MSTPNTGSASSGITTAANSHGPGSGTHAGTLDPLIPLSAARSKLEASSNFWYGFLLVASIVVAIGVILEFAEDVWELSQSIKAKKWPPVQKQIVFIGTILVIAGVTSEFIGEKYISENDNKLRGNNAAAQGVLDKRARDATQAAVTLANRFGGLSTFVSTTLNNADKQRRQFAALAASDETKNRAVVADLVKNRDALNVEKAAAMSAATAAKQDLADIDATLKQERALRAQFAAAVTPRKFDQAHFDALIAALKPFSGTKVDFSTTRDPEGADVLFQIDAAMVRAGWKPQSWTGTGFTLSSTSLPGLQLGNEVGHGIQVIISKSDVNDEIGRAGLALARSLATNGFLVFAQSFDDKDADGKPSPNAVKPGMVHVVIGTRQ